MRERFRPSLSSMAALTAAALTFGTLHAQARCVRVIAESGAVLVRCADGVRGHLSSDDNSRPAASVVARPSSSKPSPLAYAAPSTPIDTQSVFSSAKADGSAQPADPVAGALSRTRAFGASLPRKSFP